MKDFADVTPTEKKREDKIRKEGRLEKESSQRRKKKETAKQETKKTGETTKPAEAAAVAEKPAAKETEAVEVAEPSKKESTVKPKQKPKQKPVEKIEYSAKREVPELRLRKKKPKFRRQEHFKKRLDLVWRKPSGIDSKQHEGKRGKGKKPSVGYKNPEAIRGLHPLGYRPVLVHNVRELGLLNPQTEAAVIAAAVGRRKRNEVIKEANRLKITILNPRKGEI
jgi:large subunit ribosomal protein L32e